MTQRASCHRSTAAIAVVLCSVACGSVERQRDLEYPFASVSTYAWKEPAHLAASLPDERSRVAEDVQLEIDSALRQRGLRRTEKGAAEVLLSVIIAAEQRVRRNDPQIGAYRAEVVEHARISLEVFDRLQRRSVWLGEAERPLRVVARTLGGTVERFSPIDEPRLWQIDAMIQKLFNELPLGTSASQ